MEQSLYDLRMEYWRQSYKQWISQELFSFPWFFNIVFLAVLYIIWVKIVHKNRLKELVLYGSLLSVASVLVDTIAVTIGLWEYNVSILPLSPAPFPFDYTVIPIFYMLVMQYTSTWRGFLIGAVIADTVFSFIIEPVYIWLGIKVFHRFNYLYMFILVLVVTVALKAIYNWISKIQLNNCSKNEK
jgi:hypothetical protein